MAARGTGGTLGYSSGHFGRSRLNNYYAALPALTLEALSRHSTGTRGVLTGTQAVTEVYSRLPRGSTRARTLAAARSFFFKTRDAYISPHAHKLSHTPTRLPARTHAPHRIHFGFHLGRSLCIVGYINESADAVVETRISCSSLGTFACVCARACACNEHVRVHGFVCVCV